MEMDLVEDLVLETAAVTCLYWPMDHLRAQGHWLLVGILAAGPDNQAVSPEYLIKMRTIF